jgi:hypothetical protein
MPDLFDDNLLDSAVYSLVKQAIGLETNYKEMLLQGDEVDIRIKLWRKVIDICKTEFKGRSCMPI